MKLRKTRILLKTLSFRKAWNFFLLFLSYHIARFRRKPVHWGMPVKIGIEPTTSCNLRCPECPSGLRSFTRPTGMLEMDNFRSMVDQLHQDLVYMLLYFQGEPYLNPAFLEMAAYSTQKGIYTATSTNGHYLTKERAKATVDSGISEVLISIDGTTQETYEQYRVGGQLTKVLEGVKNLVEARKEANSRTPYLIIQFLVVKPNEHQIDEVKQMGKDLGVDKVTLKTAQIYEYEKGSPLIPENQRYSRYAQQADGSYRLKNKLKNQCWKLWQGAEITWDGRVLPCCFDKDAQYVMGKLAETPFAEIWRSPAYQNFRGSLVKGRKEIDICTNCSEGTKIFTS